MGNESRSKLWRAALVIFIGLAILVGSPLFLRPYLDNQIVKGIQRRVDGEPLAYDAERFSSYLDALDQIPTNTVDPSKLYIDLPAMRQLLSRLGMRHLSLNEESRKRLELMIVSELNEMSGQDFGTDVPRWRAWQSRKDEDGGD